MNIRPALEERGGFLNFFNIENAFLVCYDFFSKV